MPKYPYISHFAFSLQIAPVASQCLGQLAGMLVAVCKNPQRPGFNHFLFEAVAALIRHGCEHDIAMLAQFESSLFPAFQIVLQEVCLSSLCSRKLKEYLSILLNVEPGHWKTARELAFIAPCNRAPIAGFPQDPNPT